MFAILDCRVAVISMTGNRDRQLISVWTTNINMLLTKMLSWTSASVVVKIGGNLFAFKLLAAEFGPSGVGRASNMLTLIALLDTMSGAGIVNGVNKYVAEFCGRPDKLQQLLGTASAITLGFATLLATLLVLAGAQVGRVVFGNLDCQWLIGVIIVVQFAIAGANVLRALLKGAGDAVGNSLAVITSSLLGVSVYWFSLRHYGYCGALIGIALIPAWPLVPAMIILHLRHHFSWCWLKPMWNCRLACKLFRFSLMTAVGTMMGHVITFLLRDVLVTHYGWDAVGLWQSMSKISDSYFHIITSFLSVYLLPLLSHLQGREIIAQEILRTLRFILPIALTVSVTTWLLRDYLIIWLFSMEFFAMRDLFAWQLAGDIFKIGTAVFGSLVLGKALLTCYLLCEVGSVAVRLLVSYWLILHHGVVGVAQAHLATYFLYFIVCLAIGHYYRRQGVSE